MAGERSPLATLLVIFALAATAGAGSVHAQVPTVPQPLTPAPFLVRRSPADLEKLTEIYNAGDWTALQAMARDIVCVIRRDAGGSVAPGDAYESCANRSEAPAGIVASALDLQRNDVAIMWTGADAFGKVRLMRVVVSASDRQPYVADLPGVSADGDRQLFEVFLSRSPLGRVTSLYTSTREDDPLLAQVPAVVRSIAGPLFTIVGTVAGALPGQAVEAAQEERRPKLSVTVKRVGLPFRRASIRLQAEAREPVSSADFAAAAARLASELAFSEVPHEPCARGLAADLATALPPVTRTAACSSSDAQPPSCMAAFDKVLASTFDAAVGTCNDGKPPRATLTALENVDEEFRDLVQTSTSASAALQVTFRNRPPVHFSFGAGAGVMLAASLTRPRVDTRSGVIVADPLTRVMTMALVNWSPKGYDDEDPAIVPAERFRPFFGVALTPDFGAVAGLNVLLVRGIGLVAGGAFLFGAGAEPSQVGARPLHPDDPYDLAVARSVFVGVSYSYK